MTPDPRDLLPLAPQDFHVLLVLAEAPRHAYGLAKAVEASPEGGVQLEIGSLYRMLARLTTAGLIEDAERRGGAGGHEARRRYYRLTSFGRCVAEAESSRLQAVLRMAKRQNLVGVKR